MSEARKLLAAMLDDRPDLASAAATIFDYTQYLLDDDERLTKGGALDGEGRDLLRTRALETIGGPVGEDDQGLDESDEEDSDDDEDS